MQTMEDSSLRPLWQLTNMLFKVRNGALIRKDVKNEGWTGYVHENRVGLDKMYTARPRIMGRKCADYSLNRGEVAPPARPA
jgi:hypothetical protein